MSDDCCQRKGINYKWILGLLILLAVILFGRQNKWFGEDDSQSMLKVREIDVTVKDGIFVPDVLLVNENERVKINFYREDPRECAEKVVLKGLGKTVKLPLEEKVSVEIVGANPGQYHMECETTCGVVIVDKKGE